MKTFEMTIGGKKYRFQARGISSARKRAVTLIKSEIRVKEVK